MMIKIRPLFISLLLTQSFFPVSGGSSRVGSFDEKGNQRQSYSLVRGQNYKQDELNRSETHRHLTVGDMSGESGSRKSGESGSRKSGESGSSGESNQPSIEERLELLEASVELLETCEASCVQSVQEPLPPEPEVCNESDIENLANQMNSIRNTQCETQLPDENPTGRYRMVCKGSPKTFQPLPHMCNAQVLVVGGGGAGGGANVAPGGGGAGAVISQSFNDLPKGEYLIKVGLGGKSNGQSGTSSEFKLTVTGSQTTPIDVIASGGGFGGYGQQDNELQCTDAGAAGGSGGGGISPANQNCVNAAGQGGPAGFGGNPGGDATSLSIVGLPGVDPDDLNIIKGGGGGGAGAAGGDACVDENGDFFDCSGPGNGPSGGIGLNLGSVVGTDLGDDGWFGGGGCAGNGPFIEDFIGGGGGCGTFSSAAFDGKAGTGGGGRGCASAAEGQFDCLANPASCDTERVCRGPETCELNSGGGCLQGAQFGGGYGGDGAVIVVYDSCGCNSTAIAPRLPLGIWN